MKHFFMLFFVANFTQLLSQGTYPIGLTGSNVKNVVVERQDTKHRRIIAYNTNSKVILDKDEGSSTHCYSYSDFDELQYEVSYFHGYKKLYLKVSEYEEQRIKQKVAYEIKLAALDSNRIRNSENSDSIIVWSLALLQEQQPTPQEKTIYWDTTTSTGRTTTAVRVLSDTSWLKRIVYEGDFMYISTYRQGVLTSRLTFEGDRLVHRFERAERGRRRGKNITYLYKNNHLREARYEEGLRVTIHRFLGRITKVDTEKRSDQGTMLIRRICYQYKAGVPHGATICDQRSGNHTVRYFIKYYD